MPEYVEKERIFDALRVLNVKAPDLVSMHDVFYALKYAICADVEPVRHGKWSADKFGNLWCSECKHCGSTDGIDTDYCPNCGAKMDAKRETK